MELAELIRTRFSGASVDNDVYFNLAIQTTAILVGGIVLWRMSNRLHNKKKKDRERNQYFESEYSRHWRKNSRR